MHRPLEEEVGKLRKWFQRLYGDRHKLYLQDHYDFKEGYWVYEIGVATADGRKGQWMTTVPKDVFDEDGELMKRIRMNFQPRMATCITQFCG